MEARFERVYLTEIILQSNYALQSVLRVNARLQEGAAPELLFGELYALLAHAAGVSRILWPPRIRDPAQSAIALARGSHLRQVLGIPDEHVLRSRTLRDHLEHFDERLDRWAQETNHAGLVDLHIGPTSVLGGAAIARGDFLRVYEPERSVFTFRGDEFDVQALTTGIENTRALAAQRMEQL